MPGLWKNGGVIILTRLSMKKKTKRTILRFLPRECEVRPKQGRVGGDKKGEGNFVILNPKANSCYYWPVLFFRVWGGGSAPFELFRCGDNGWMLRTYVERPLWLTDEELHAGPAVWENTRPLLSLLTPPIMNAWMAECRYGPFRGQSPQEFTLAQMHPAIANTFA